ncbi:ABC transporter permease [Hirschia baltica]|uniref:ABC-type Na+ efflux pump permease component-like protein n=1 Tax=Hirschia baltica (strain ATCC 49814 / DSM 5838 / IFAM 1418) TaxID=582402 RepID=C6XRL2_HIRBI|nr:ABC transporter permease [Hirschia baltica]ACT60622.1 ABC-type Na+ efflux pump permease component-like protein [Hirschia baltica ATCC 49814]
MIRSIWLVARREYLGYVSALGFWLGLILTPLGLAVGVLVPGMIMKAQPARYYAVVDTQDSLQEALDWQFESWQSSDTKMMLRQSLSTTSPAEKRRIINVFEKAYAEGSSPQEALDKADAPLHLKASPINFHPIKLPNKSVEEVEKILTSGQTFNGPVGRHTLFAAIIVNRDQIGNIASVDYISPDIVNSELKQAVTGALKYLARLELFKSVGVTPTEIRNADADIPSLFVRKPGSLEPNENQSSEVTLTDRAPFVAATSIAIALWLLIFSVVNFLLTGTIEERSNKIFDSLLTSVSVTDLLSGKLLGVLMLSATLLCAWMLMATWAALYADQAISPAAWEFAQAALDPALILPALAGFLAGYLLYGAVFLALGAMCDTIQEAQALATPLILLLTTPLFIIIMALQNPASGFVFIMSWVPPLTPFLMILRAPLEPPLIEVLGHLALMLVSTSIALWCSIRVYRAGAVNGFGVKEIVSFFKKKTMGKSKL